MCLPGAARAWLAADPGWIPPASERTAAVLARLVDRYEVSANLLPDAQLAALAIEHGLTVISADSDFARLDELSWHNPLAGG
ncbi:MAG TPA: PIN domain-containing protein [Mycobacteriales bacterium]